MLSENKLDVVINGDGQKFVGIGDADEDAILAEYDRRGGLIMKDGKKVANGAFWDFKKKAPRKEPLVEFAPELKKKPKETLEEFGDKEGDAKTAKPKVNKPKARK